MQMLQSLQSMRRVPLFWLFLVTLLALTVPVLAADAPPSGEAALANSILLLTPVAIPFLIWGVKKALPSIPSMLIPILATALGVLVEVINKAMTGTDHGLIVGALLGAAAVGVREILDQTKKTVVPSE